MTKLMTFLVIHDKIQSGALTLQTPVTVNAADSKIGGTQVWLKEKEVFPVEELLYAMMIQSANDAAHALARTAAGSTDAFVELMNAKARELGMTHTTFRTPHGLPPANRHLAEGDLTTPLDFALLCRHLVLKTDVLKYTSIKSRKFGEGVRPANHRRRHGQRRLQDTRCQSRRADRARIRCPAPGQPGLLRGNRPRARTFSHHRRPGACARARSWRTRYQVRGSSSQEVTPGRAL
jgi:D-alanyl-D-alanine carboxypeptidase